MPNRIDCWSRLLASGLLGLMLALTVPAGAVEPSCGIDIDGNGTAEPGTDAQLLVRHLFGFTGTTLTKGVMGAGCTRCNPAAIATFLDSPACQVLFDVDGNGRRDGLTDGVLVWRLLSGLSGDALIGGVVGLGCSRCTEDAILAHVSPPPPFPLNDTGITLCGTDSQTNVACPVSGFPGQDAEYGRDVTHNDPSDGHAGFSFTKISNSGNPLPASAALGSGPNAWACTRDNVTGLVWEVKTNDNGLRHKGWFYSWYNPDASTNGGYAGTADYRNFCYNTARCDTHKFIEDVNLKGLCGASDWRLPSKDELLSIVRNDRYNPAIDTAFFPNTPSVVSFLFWSSSPSASSTDVWVVDFSYGGTGATYKHDQLFVRLVRGRQ